jgi:DNA-binding protein YbaB
MLADLNDLRTRIAAAREELAQRRVSETSKDHLVTATIAAGGALVDLKFNTTAYRSMAPAELAGAVRETVERARVRMQRELMETVQPLMPGAVRVRDVAEGRLSVEEFLDEARRGRGGGG